MYRFVDRTAAYWALDESDPEYPGKPCCGIIETAGDVFLCDDFGSPFLTDFEAVRQAGGERALALVPDGFFEGKIRT